MMKRGILVYDHTELEWRAWIGQQSYWVSQGQLLELRISNRYFKAFFEKDISEWFVTLDNEVSFSLRVNEVYKIRLLTNEFILVDTPF